MTYLLTMGKTFVRYQNLPAFMNYHWVSPVIYEIVVNPDGSQVKYWSGFFRCNICGLVGGNETMNHYRCV